MFYQSLEDIIEEMRSVGDLIIDHNFPKMPVLMEDDLIIFKQREVVIDGYSVTVNYQKSDYGDIFMETLQIYGTNSPFLPFNLICKLGKRFLGSHNLSLVELFKDNKKIYIWTVWVDEQGKPCDPPYEIETEECVFEGLQYSYMQPNQVDFY
jgi:hypothetical protein